MKKLLLVSMLFLLILNNALTQVTEASWGIRFSGFIKNDIFYDTRQSGAANGLREGHFFLFPDNVLRDIDGNDINANPSFHILNIQSRLKGDITGPDALGAKTSGVIEAEFFGTGETDINGFRLRHAFVKMDWPNTTLIIGQAWHPMFPEESFPGTISFNTGAPFTPFSRNPQVRFRRMLGDISLSVTAYSQRDFVSAGPDGNSNRYLRNSGMPGADLQIKIPAGAILTLWSGADYKKIRPELRTPANFETDETIGSFSAYMNMKFVTKPLNISIMGVYAQNATDLMMLGGYAVSGTIDPMRQIREYTNLNTGSMWADISTKGKKMVFGLFTGYSMNMGAVENITGTVYGRGSNIDHLFRISPRTMFTEGKLSFAAEAEITSASYGLMRPDGRVTGTDAVTNVRILLSTIYRF
jgi:hypothetical protein